jgi:hypothetical protein
MYQPPTFQTSLIDSAAPAIRRNALLGYPQSSGRAPGLPEHVDRDAAARIPVATDPQPAWREEVHQATCDRQRAVLVECAVIAKGLQVQLERLALDEPAARYLVQHEVCEIGLPGNRAQRREFRHGKAHETDLAWMRVRHALEQRFIR